MANRPRALMEEVDKAREVMSYVNKDTKTIKKQKKKEKKGSCSPTAGFTTKPQ